LREGRVHEAAAYRHDPSLPLSGLAVNFFCIRPFFLVRPLEPPGLPRGGLCMLPYVLNYLTMLLLTQQPEGYFISE